MANKFIIPSIFTAVDEMSPTMLAMRNNVTDFGNKAEGAIAKADRVIRKLTPGLGAAQKQLLSMVGTGALLAGGLQLGRFSFNSLADYEEAVDSFRTIVSDLNDSEFSEFQNKIDEVAKKSKRSGTEVAQAFEKIAGLNARFADTAEGIGLVTDASITLAKAAKMDLGIAAENLVGIMNQFSFGADQANRTINVLAAGQAVGAANITQTAEAFVNFGAVAAGANITLEESVGLVQTLGKYSLFSADAGTALKGSIVRLQKAGLGYASGQFDIVDALEQLNNILGKAKTAKTQDAILTKVFGAQQIVAGRILANNVETFKQFANEVTGTSEAQKAAVINSGNLKSALKELSDGWVNMLTGTGDAKSATEQLTGAVRWLTENLGFVVNTTISAVKWYAIIKGGILAAKAAMAIWNVTLGISTAITGASTIAMQTNTTALGAQRIALFFTKGALMGQAAATGAATTAQWSLNAAMAANPLGVITLGILALTAAVGGLIYYQHKLNEEYEAAVTLRMQRSYDNELKAVDDLTKRLMQLGYSYAEATKKALEFERANNLQKQDQLRSDIESLKVKRKEKEVQLGVVMQSVNLPGHDAIQDEINAKMALLTDAMKEGSAITNRAVGFTQQEAPKMQVPLEAKNNEKFSRTDLLNFFSKSSDKTEVSAKNELTLSIKNESDNTVTMSSGKTRLVDVMPKTTSTKQVRSAYGK